MWRSHTVRKGRQIIGTVRRQLASEASNASAPAPPPPHPPKKSGGFGLVKFFGLGLPLATGGVVGYAWYDSDFRQQLEDNVPYAKDLLDNVLPSEGSDQGKQSKEIKAPQALERATMLNAQDQGLATANEMPPPSVFSSSVLPSASCSTNLNKNEFPEGNAEESTKEGQNINKKQQTISSTNDSKISDNKDDSDVQDDVETDNDNVEDPCKNEEENNFDGYEFNSSVPDESQNVQLGRFMDELLSDDLGTSKSGGLGMEKQKSKKDEVELQLRTKEEEEKADNAALEVIINKLMDSSQYLTSEAAKAQMQVASATRNHTMSLKKAMDDSSDILQKDAQWEEVAMAYKERDDALARANDLVSEARKSLGKLKTVLEEGKNTKTTQKNSAIYPANKKLTEMTKDLTRASAKVREADADAKVLLKYKDLVDKGRRQFQMELESLVPDVKLGNKSRKLTEEELNSLIAHAHRRIEQLQKQIAEQLSLERKRLETALEIQRQEDRRLTEAAVVDENSRLQKEFELEKQRDELDFLVYQEEEVRRQLTRQAAAHSDHLKDVLAVQHDHLSADFERQLNLKLLEEREKFQTEVAGWMSRLKGIESAVDARAASEKLARTAQDLWLACIALNSAISFNDEEDSNLVPLKQKVEAVVKSSNMNPFVENVASAVPSTALDRGVHTEKVIRDRFVKVSKVCRRLGLITEANASLYKYIISFVHSFLKFDSVNAFSEHDLVDIDELDNCKLVAIAQYWLERDNLEMAVRFMSQLTGESRKAASGWIEEATLLLETRQVAHALSAYASATGLATTF